MTPAIIELAFDPAVRVGDVVLRWQALALAATIALALVVFVLRLRRRAGPIPLADIAFVVLAAVPGAVVGGRAVHGLVHWQGYAGVAETLLDLGYGSLSLAGALAGGAITAGYVCRAIGGRVGTWADAASVPVLLAIGLGKAAMLLGGAGQGLPFEGRGAVAFVGPGPWWSADAAVPAYPTQLLEGIWALLGVPVVAWFERRLARRGAAGRGLALLFAVLWWLTGRAAVAVWWRDQPWVGQLGGEGLVALVLAAVAAGLLLVGLRRAGRARGRRGPAAPAAHPGLGR